MPRPAIAIVAARRRAAATALIAALSTSHAARADDSLLYAGASLGQGNTKVGQINFNKTDLGWKAVVGTRPLRWLGAEVAYIDFGNPKETYPLAQSRARATGAAAYGLFYLPLPLPLVDVYAKAGLARVHTTANSYSTTGTCTIGNPDCGLFALDRKNTQPTYGVGAQAHLGDLAARLEYEHFETAGGSPSLLTLGFTYSFL
jgi:Outer membrane protein beta-barrel domain